MDNIIETHRDAIDALNAADREKLETIQSKTSEKMIETRKRFFETLGKIAADFKKASDEASDELRATFASAVQDADDVLTVRTIALTVETDRLAKSFDDRVRFFRTGELPETPQLPKVENAPPGIVFSAKHGGYVKTGRTVLVIDPNDISPDLKLIDTESEVGAARVRAWEAADEVITADGRILKNVREPIDVLLGAMADRLVEKFPLGWSEIDGVRTLVVDEATFDETRANRDVAEAARVITTDGRVLKDRAA